MCKAVISIPRPEKRRQEGKEGGKGGKEEGRKGGREEGRKEKKAPFFQLVHKLVPPLPSACFKSHTWSSPLGCNKAQVPSH